MNRADLHIHTDLSDGSFSRDDLITLATSANLDVISFTDHDIIRADSIPVRQVRDLVIISGIELSIHFNQRDIHVLGYFIAGDDNRLREYINRFRKERENRILKIVKKLNHLGIRIDSNRIFEIAGEGTVGRPHVAQAIIEKGYYSTVNAVFRELLREGGPAWVRKYKLDIRNAIDIIHHAGGLAFLAHPAADDMVDFFRSLKRLGLDGVEAFHPRQTDEQVQSVIEQAEACRLLISGGSDFHGPGYGEEHLGQYVVDAKYYRLMHDLWKSTQ